jgi:hypothetical protein
MSDTKVCTKCGEEKPFSEFYKCGKKSTKRSGSCKDCDRAVSRAYCKAHYDRKATYIRQRKWVKANPERWKELQKRNYLKRQKEGNLIRQWVIKKYGGKPCMDCKQVFPWVAMDFDHRPEHIKEFAIGEKCNVVATPKAIARIEKEIAKCDVVCSNCHRIRTYITRKA